MTGVLVLDTGEGSTINQGNFRELLKFRVNADDTVLQNH